MSDEMRAPQEPYGDEIIEEQKTDTGWYLLCTAFAVTSAIFIVASFLAVSYHARIVELDYINHNLQQSFDSLILHDKDVDLESIVWCNGVSDTKLLRAVMAIDVDHHKVVLHGTCRQAMDKDAFVLRNDMMLDLTDATFTLIPPPAKHRAPSTTTPHTIH